MSSLVFMLTLALVAGATNTPHERRQLIDSCVDKLVRHARPELRESEIPLLLATPVGRQLHARATEAIEAIAPFFEDQTLDATAMVNLGRSILRRQRARWAELFTQSLDDVMTRERPGARILGSLAADLPDVDLPKHSLHLVPGVDYGGPVGTTGLELVALESEPLRAPIAEPHALPLALDERGRFVLEGQRVQLNLIRHLDFYDEGEALGYFIVLRPEGDGTFAVALDGWEREWTQRISPATWTLAQRYAQVQVLYDQGRRVLTLRTHIMGVKSTDVAVEASQRAIWPWARGEVSLVDPLTSVPEPGPERAPTQHWVLGENYELVVTRIFEREYRVRLRSR